MLPIAANYLINQLTAAIDYRYYYYYYYYCY